MRQRLSYANVVSTIALIFALGTGGAWAATQINGSLLKKNTVAGNRLKKATITHREINEAKLKQVPKAKDAQTLVGLAPSAFLPASAAGGFVQGQGNQSAGHLSVPAGQNPNVVRTFTTAVGEFRLGCGNANADVRFHNTTAGTADVFRFHFRGAGDDDTNFDQVPENGDVGFAGNDAVGPVYVDIRAGKGDNTAILRVGQRREGLTCIWDWELVTTG
jgi:hypothetical protein